MATFKVGSRYPITQSTYSTTTPSTGTTGLTGATIGGVSVSSLLAQATTATVPQIQYEDLGLTLKATPSIGKYGQVSLHLDLSITALHGTSIDNIPILDSTLFTSDITVQDGSTATLVSNLTRNQAAAVAGIPGSERSAGLSKQPRPAHDHQYEPVGDGAHPAYRAPSPGREPRATDPDCDSDVGRVSWRLRARTRRSVKKGNPQRIHSHDVDRSRLSAYTWNCESGSSSVVECFLAKEDVAGSTPVSRSKTVPF